ncbi:MAG: ABC transporter permease [Chitinophagaceae bacterium]|nr:ABC transporter permease [Chitinophagaceae bacterium]
MIKNLIRVALRNFQKDKGYSLLNILGLTIGITFSLLLIFYVFDELSYDRYNEKADRIHRVNSDVKEPENAMKWAITQYPLAPALKKDYPEVEESMRFVNAGRLMLKRGEKQFYEEKMFYADSNIFRIFTHKFLAGNSVTGLYAPNSIVLTKALAIKYFGTPAAAINQTLENQQREVFKVTAVVDDVPKNSHIIFNGLISSSTLPRDYASSWGQFGFYTYVLLKPGTSAAAFEKKILPMYDKYMAPIFAQFNIKIKYTAQPIADIHLHSQVTSEPEETGSMSYIYIFVSVAFFMLVIACINYMNMATARSARRAKEIGIRKVTGSSRGQLITQFLTESILITIFSLVLSLIAIYLLLPYFNTLAGKFITFSSLLTLRTILVLVAIVVFVGFLGGSYPAFYLSKFQPLAVLKGKLSKGSSNVILRRTLVVAQFSISMVMLICTWIVSNQLNYMKTKDLGFSKDHVVSIAATGNRDYRSQISSFQNELRQNPQVVSLATADGAPGAGNMNFNLFSVESKKGFIDKGVDCYGIDDHYTKTLNIPIVKGRNFTGASDTLRSILVNESMVKSFGWDEPIGKRVKYPGDTSGFYLEVVGVMKDFHVKSLYNPINPVLVFYRPNNSTVIAKVVPGNISTSIASIENAWKKFFPDMPFRYSFLDQDFNSQYAADQRRGKIFTSFSTLTIIITCLGLLGLIAFTTEQRRKEISIRKIMGASLPHIVSLIAANFILLVGISCIIAFPVAFYFMNRWLEVFPYKEGLKVSTFLFSGLAVLVIALLTVSFHTIKVALSNPVNSLRTE